jgi:hypothetical protein
MKHISVVTKMQKEQNFKLNFYINSNLKLKKEAACTSETSVIFIIWTRRNI